MIVICAHCNTVQGEMEPLDNKMETHGICLDCMPDYLREGGVPESEIEEFMKGQGGSNGQ